MPKMKGHSGAKKRFRISKNGRIKIAHQGKNHPPNPLTTSVQGWKLLGHLLNLLFFWRQSLFFLYPFDIIYN